MKEAIKNASIKISTACIDGKMNEYEKLTNEMKKQSEKLNVINKKRDKIVKEKEQFQKEQDTMQDRLNKANTMLNDLIELKEKSTKLENLDSSSNDANSVKKFVNEINKALDGLNVIGAISLSDEKFNCDKFELPTDLIISNQRVNKSKKNNEKVKEKKVEIVEKPTTRKNQITPNKVENKRNKLHKASVISEDEESQQTKSLILTELSEDCEI